MRTAFVTALVIVVSAGSFPAEERGSAVPVRIDEHGGVMVAVSVDDAGPFTFVVDTGSSRTIIADDLARVLAAPVVARTEVVTSGGTDVRPVARLRSVSVGAARRGGLLVPVVPAARLAPLGRAVRGILAQDFLSAHNYTLDYRRGTLRWDDPVACDGSGAIPLSPSEGRFVVSAHDAAGRVLRLVPDSGAQALVLFRAPGRTDGRARAMTVGIAGDGRVAEATRLPRLRVGTLTLTNVDAYAIERDEPGVDGLLPLHRFSRVSFAAGGACMVVA